MASTQPVTRKRQQIDKSGRTMFIWVSGMSAVVGICLVVAYSLGSYLQFESEVIGAKMATASRLESNVKNASELKTNIQALSADQQLNHLKADDSEDTLQVVLDALPADANSLALGSSLQNSILGAVNGISIDQLTVNPVGDEQSSDGSGDAASDITIIGDNTNIITFHLVVSSRSPDALKRVLTQMERSIRVIDVDTLSIDSSTSSYSMTIDAHAFYQPAVQMQLNKKTVTAHGLFGGK